LKAVELGFGDVTIDVADGIYGGAGLGAVVSTPSKFIPGGEDTLYVNVGNKSVDPTDTTLISSDFLPANSDVFQPLTSPPAPGFNPCDPSTYPGLWPGNWF
jgi:hypothetical protein